MTSEWPSVENSTELFYYQDDIPNELESLPMIKLEFEENFNEKNFFNRNYRSFCIIAFEV